MIKKKVLVNFTIAYDANSLKNLAKILDIETKLFQDSIDESHRLLKLIGETEDNIIRLEPNYISLIDDYDFEDKPLKLKSSSLGVLSFKGCFIKPIHNRRVILRDKYKSINL